MNNGFFGFAPKSVLTPELILDKEVFEADFAEFRINIEKPYAFLEICIFGRSSYVSAQTPIYMSFNNDTTAGNYRKGWHYASNIPDHGFGVADDRACGYVAGSVHASSISVIKFWIPSPRSPFFHKILMSDTFGRYSDTISQIINTVMAWENTDPISIIRIDAGVYTWVPGSRCTCIGWIAENP